MPKKPKKANRKNGASTVSIKDVPNEQWALFRAKSIILNLTTGEAITEAIKEWIK